MIRKLAFGIAASLMTLTAFSGTVTLAVLHVAAAGGAKGAAIA